MSLEEYNLFVKNIRKMNLGHYLRKGQRAFIMLHNQYPNIANAIQGTEFDPFYDDNRLDAFLGKVAEYVYET